MVPDTYVVLSTKGHGKNGQAQGGDDNLWSAGVAQLVEHSTI